VTLVERCFAVGLIVWWASGSVVSNAFDGFRRLHNLEWSDTARTVLWIGFLVVTGVPLVIWLVRTRAASQQGAPTNAFVLPWAVLPAVIGLIIVCGYLVSVPSEWERNNYVLVSMYTVYLIVTAGLLAYLRLRGNKAP
jgi:prolipoprotein diacylglyceryltransferase